jgi:hypothetical protein
VRGSLERGRTRSRGREPSSEAEPARGRREPSSEAEPDRGGREPSSEVEPARGGRELSSEVEPARWGLDWSILVGRGGHRGVGRALCVRLSRRCVLLLFFAGFMRDSPGCLGDPQGCPRQ